MEGRDWKVEWSGLFSCGRPIRGKGLHRLEHLFAPPEERKKLEKKLYDISLFPYSPSSHYLEPQELTEHNQVVLEELQQLRQSNDAQASRISELEESNAALKISNAALKKSNAALKKSNAALKGNDESWKRRARPGKRPRSPQSSDD